MAAAGDVNVNENRENNVTAMAWISVIASLFPMQI